mmetsp:Transcript_128067/g.222068  ORF Transcript_128067/g.222068 Transcript_128067/m.222068 type:complete len:203 (+) Transcript_128067:276-884(+)
MLAPVAACMPCVAIAGDTADGAVMVPPICCLNIIICISAGDKLVDDWAAPLPFTICCDACVPAGGTGTGGGGIGGSGGHTKVCASVKAPRRLSVSSLFALACALAASTAASALAFASASALSFAWNLGSSLCFFSFSSRRFFRRSSLSRSLSSSSACSCARRSNNFFLHSSSSRSLCSSASFFLFSKASSIFFLSAAIFACR